MTEKPWWMTQEEWISQQRALYGFSPLHQNRWCEPLQLPKTGFKIKPGQPFKTMNCYPCTGHIKIIRWGFYETEDNIIRNEITFWGDVVLYFRRAFE